MTREGDVTHSKSVLGPQQKLQTDLIFPINLINKQDQEYYDLTMQYCAYIFHNLQLYNIYYRLMQLFTYLSKILL